MFNSRGTVNEAIQLYKHLRTIPFKKIKGISSVPLDQYRYSFYRVKKPNERKNTKNNFVIFNSF